MEPEVFALEQQNIPGVARAKGSKKQATAAHLSLIHTLGTFLRLPGIFQTVLEYINALKNETDVISNIIQARMWRTKYENVMKLILPLFIFYDDFESKNALGSHAGEQKFGGVSVSLPFLPPYLASKLSNIFVATIFKAKHRAKYGNRAVFQRVIDDLKQLSREGIKLVVNSVEYIVYFECALVVGDNLGVNAACGLVENFVNTCCCIICIANSEEMKTMIFEQVSLLRTKENHALDVLYLTNGIKEDCIFHQLRFRLGENNSFDLMHTIIEGTGKDVIERVLTAIVCEEEMITLGDLNKIIDQFPYGGLESGNKPRPLTLEKCSEEEKKILRVKKKIRAKQSASEMLCLIRYLILMIGDIMSLDFKPWKLYCLLRRKIGIVTAPRFRETKLHELTSIIAEHDALFIELYGHKKPKGHFEIHMPRVMRDNGPLTHFWGMKFERKNSELKRYANSSSSSVNLPYTIAIQCALQLCYMREMYKGCGVDIKLGQVDNHDASAEVRRIMPLLDESTISVCHRSVEIEGNNLSEGTVLFIGVDDSFGEPEFGKVQRIYKVGDEIMLHLSSLPSVCFEPIYHAYEVRDNNIADTIMNLRDIYEILPCVYIEKECKWYVAMRFDL
ncbi:hypothetical protein QAD02_013749 [Eretmocerus hayati]|uniref:Uncharacterized protein n=1 Tax=Eretmocerus hayati TaxID=131215 RepID=A0ACC2P3J7_9HYME|nr:hypothetical protein QAD02_013749 [Eretmocerus hayati]